MFVGCWVSELLVVFLCAFFVLCIVQLSVLCVLFLLFQHVHVVGFLIKRRLIMGRGWDGAFGFTNGLHVLFYYLYGY